MTRHWLTVGLTLISLLLVAIQAVPKRLCAASEGTGSCYEMIEVGSEIEVPSIDRELIVLVDRTAQLSQDLYRQAEERILEFLLPGSRVKLVLFAAYIGDDYTEVVLDKVVEEELSDAEKYHVRKDTLRRLANCLAQQRANALAATRKELRDAAKDTNREFPKTEILSALERTGGDLMESGEPRKRFMLIVSDMLENSPVTSFYSGGKIRPIEADVEWKKVVASGLRTDFGRARVYVLGAGYSPNGSFRGAPLMQNLEDFWTKYFEESNADLVEFGRPQLMRRIGR